MTEVTRDPDEEGTAPTPSPRPRDAATLVLWRQDGKEPALLMGRRHKGHVFMPNKFAFPGGAVDRADASLIPYSAYSSRTERLLATQNRRRSPRSLGLAAIRETFEETGLRIGASGTGKASSRTPSWQRFMADGARPTLHGLTFIARAITPPRRSRRFDARFFLVPADEVLGNPDDFGQASGELQDLQWVPLSKVDDLDLPYITRGAHGLYHTLDHRSASGTPGTLHS